MNLLSKKAFLAATATVALTTATTVFTSNPAHAFKVFTTSGQTVNNTVVNGQVPVGWLAAPPDPTTFDFNNLSGAVPNASTLLNTSATNGSVNIQAGSTGATYSSDNLSPTSPNSNYLLISPGQTVTLTFSPRQEYFGFLWGKTDTGNIARAGQSIEFFKAGVKLDATFDIATINSRLASSAVSSEKSLPNNAPIFINFMASNTAELFDTIVLKSSGSGANSFRIDNIAYQIPTPALLPGLIAFGAGVLRKRKDMDEVCEDSVNS